jgi:hydroxyacylglutathione hydrolase
MAFKQGCSAVLAALVAALLTALPQASFAQTQPASAAAPNAPQVVTFKLSYSNVHLIKSSPPVLIDAGSPSDWLVLSEQLAAHQIQVCDIRWVIITHAHQDHAGLAHQFQQKCGAKIAMHLRDVPIAAAGGFDPDLKFTRLMSRVVWKLVNYTYPAFKPDLVWSMAEGESVDLAALGLAARAVSVPGHTPGSLAIALNDGRAFIGDMMAGGYLGGALHSTQASEHYFHGDSARNYRWLAALLDMGLHTFYIGHGGPLLRESVADATRSLAAKPHSDVPIHPQPAIATPSSQPTKESP